MNIKMYVSLPSWQDLLPIGCGVVCLMPSQHCFGGSTPPRSALAHFVALAVSFFLWQLFPLLLLLLLLLHLVIQST